MKSYFDIVGDGGSNVLAQVEEQQRVIREALSGVRYLLAVGSGKGGVGKSTVTMALARALRRRDLEVSIFDADINGPCQAKLAGLDVAPWIPGEDGLSVPRSADGIGVVSFGSLLPEASPLELTSVVRGEEQVWRGTKEFALLRQLLGSVAWGRPDVLLFDLPPGSERTVQFADLLGGLGRERPTDFVLVTVPSDLSRSVVARSITALRGASGSAGKPSARLLGWIENMAGYYCGDCEAVRPLFPSSEIILDAPCLGEIPFDPLLARPGLEPGPEHPAIQAIDAIARRLTDHITEDSKDHITKDLETP